MADNAEYGDDDVAEQVVELIENLADGWAQAVDLDGLASQMMRDPAGIADLCRQAFVEGAHRGLRILCSRGPLCMATSHAGPAARSDGPGHGAPGVAPDLMPAS